MALVRAYYELHKIKNASFGLTVSGTTAKLGVDYELAERDSQLAKMPTQPDPSFNWLGVASIVSTIFLWLFSAMNSLLSWLFKAQLDSKLDHKAVTMLIDQSITKYHDLFARELRDESNEKHAENRARLMRIEDLLLRKFNGNGAK